MPASSTSALLNVLIYSGPGTCEFSVKQTFRTLSKYLMNSYDVKLIDSGVLRNDRIPWEENCALFVMPGGRDLIYLDEFRGSGFIQKLRNCVLGGRMKYLGLCAGAYFAADRVEFEIGRKAYEVKGDRPLKLINAPAIGAVNDKFFYSCDVDATRSQKIESLQAVNVKLLSGKVIKLACNGGCYFPKESNFAFATYSDYNDNTAIILNESFCLSGVHFEYDPIDCLSLENKTVFSELMKYENDRMELIRKVLETLGLNVKEDADVIMDSVNIYTNDLKSLKFKDSSIKIIERPSDNNKFFTLYSPICTSTQTILLNEPELLDNLPNYTIYVADHQVNGRGRSGNYWISSPACLQFTVKVEHPLNKSSGLPLIQFLMAISICEAINSFKFRSDDIKARIKWPNDIYISNIKNKDDLIGKVSGILVNCTQSHKKSVNQVLIGVGINLLSDPSLTNITHLNDYLQSPCDKEPLLYEVLERFKYTYETFIRTDTFPFEDYYANWLHSNQQIKDEEGKSLRITGIDEFGYLLAASMGIVYKFEPDGNSFDMMKNLIKRKQ